MWISKKEYTDILDELDEKKKETDELKDEIETLEIELEIKQKHICDSRSVMETIMKEKIEWYDYKELSHPGRVSYYQEAQKILHADIFHNEINYLTSQWAKFALEKADDFAVIRDMRMSANGLKLLKERFKEIENPILEEPTFEEITSAV